MEINNRMSSILYLILASKGRISMESLMEETGVSKRALYYDLNKINVCLTDSGVGPISLEDGECMIRDEERGVIESILESQVIHLASRNQRMIVEALYIALNDEPMTIEMFRQEFDVSKNTIQTDLKLLKEEVVEHSIVLAYANKDGYYFEGNEMDIRNYISDSLHMIKNNGIQNMVIHMLNQMAAKSVGEDSGKGDIYQLILEEIQDYGESISTGFLDSFVSRSAEMIMVALIRSNAGYECRQLEQTGRRTLSYTEEFTHVRTMVKNLRSKGIKIPETEEYYIAYLLLGMKRFSFRGEMNQEIADTVDIFLDNLEKNLGKSIEKREELRRKLSLHMEPMFYRLKLGFRTNNVLLEDIRQMYPRGFGMVSDSIRSVGGEIGELITEDEISFLVMFVESHMADLEMGRESSSAGRILIICGTGVSTSVFVRSQLQDILGDGFQYDLSAVSAVKEEDFNKYCLIISMARDAKLPPETIYVSAILSEKDTDHIIRRLCTQTLDLHEISVEDIMNVIEDDVRSKDEVDKIRRDLFQFFVKGGDRECQL